MGVMVSPEHKMVVLPYEERLINLFPSAQRLGPDHVALHHGADETRVLRNMGFRAPAPIHHYYEWPGKKPFEAQRVTAAMLSIEKRAYVLSGLGTGKTRSVLYAFDFLRQQGLVKSMIVVAPLSTLNFTWRREIFETFPHLRVQVLHGTRKQRLLKLAEPADIYVINHDGIKVITKELERRKFDVWVFDELTAFRNNRAARSKAAQQLTSHSPRVWGLTGTPMPKEPTDTFGQMRLITPGEAPRSFLHFRIATMTQVNQFKWVAKPGAQDYVYKLMQPAVRFSLEDCVDMPPEVEVNREVTLGPKTKKIYTTLVNEMMVMADGHEITAMNAGVLRGKLLQVAAGVVYDKHKHAVVVDDSDRFGIMCELLEQTTRPALIFCPWRSLVEHVHAKMEKAGYNVRMVYGGTSSKDRDQTFAMVQTPNSGLDGVVAHPATMSHGLNLFGSDMVIWYALIDNLETYLQANARIRRPGQTSDRTRVCHLYGTPIENIVRSRLRSRRSMQDALLELFEK